MKDYKKMLIIMSNDLSACSEEYPLYYHYELDMTSIMTNAIKTIGSYEEFIKYEINSINFKKEEQKIIVFFEKQPYN